jgi:threonine dehydrogenase-like Zn-dependent dehydrogenase
MGAVGTIGLDEPVVERVEELTGGVLCDVVVEAAGTQATLDLAGALTRTRGRLVIAGFHQDGPRQVDMQLWNWRGLDVVNAHERDPRVYLEGIRKAVAAVADGRLDPSPLYTHSFGLDELDAAFDISLERPEGFVKALVMA